MDTTSRAAPDSACRPRLAWVESALPGVDSAERLAMARRQGLALELAHQPGRRPERPVGLEVVTLQAWGLHHAHPLHPDPARREEAARHVRATIELAAGLGAPRVLTVCGYGREVVERPLESCRAFFAALAPLARARGVRLLIELLGPHRAAAMGDPADLERLLEELGAADVFAAALDTGHLLDAGRDPLAVLEAWRAPLEELQLRGPLSRPPDTDVPLARWLGALTRPPDVVCVEHREPIAPDAQARLVEHLRRELDASPARGGGACS